MRREQETFDSVDASSASDYARCMGPVAHSDIDLVENASSTSAEEYRALSSGAGLIDRTDVGRLTVRGEDALDLLDRLSTNELATLEAGSGAATVLTTNKGRIVDLLFVHQGEDSLVVFTSPGNQTRVAEWIDFYTFVEDVEVEDRTNETAMLSLSGPGSVSLMDALTDGQASLMGVLERLSADIAGAQSEVYRSDFLGSTSYDIVVDAADKDRLSTLLIEKGAMAVGANTIESVRVERGIPAFGNELTEDYNPHEANLVHHVSFSKGCYIGQEVITRLQTYKKVSKFLVGLQWDGEGPVEGSFLTRDGKRMGVVTSAARVPHTGAKVGLGYVRKDFVAEGMTVADESGNEVRIKALA